MSDTPLMTASDPTALREALAQALWDDRYGNLDDASFAGARKLAREIPDGAAAGCVAKIYACADALVAGPLASLLDRLAKAEGERDEALTAIAEKAAGETLLTHMGPRGDGFVMELRDGPVPYIAEYLARVLGLGSDEPLSNYAQVEVHHREIGDMVLTLQRHSGLTPAQKAAKAEAEREAALAERDALQAQVARLKPIAEGLIAFWNRIGNGQHEKLDDLVRHSRAALKPMEAEHGR